MTNTDIDKQLEDVPTTQCHCSTCVSMCKNFPCIGTVTEMQRLIDLGHADRLMLVNQFDYRRGGAGTEVLMPAGEGFERSDNDIRLNGWCQARCVFLTAEDRCSLHADGLKPIEGRAATCSDDNDDRAVARPVRSLVFRDFRTPRGRALLEQWRKMNIVKGEDFDSSAPIGDQDYACTTQP